MKFIDEAIIELEAGNGGDGSAAFRREKYVPKGGPAGGDGGDGGSVIFKTDGGLTTLMDVRYRHKFRAERGGHGMGKQMTGACGEDVVVRIPAGTSVFDNETGELLADLNAAGIEWIAAKGGKGGLGNMHFTSSVHQAPREFTKGGRGEKRKVRLELKLLADVGLVGFPNAGKSTLISALSNARPKVAAYPFTTKVPCLGLVSLGEGRSFVMADIPGLIEGAHEGAGMGIQFLRHIERTKVTLHLIDITDPSHSDPVDMYKAIRGELESYNPDLAGRPEITILTKMDLTETHQKSKKAVAALKRAGATDLLTISAATRDGLDVLLNKIGERLGI